MTETLADHLTVVAEQDVHEVTSLDELESILDSVHSSGLPTWVEIVTADESLMLDVGLGADYSSLRFYDMEAPAKYGSRGTLPMPDDDAEFHLGGTPTTIPPDSAIPVTAARQATREFATTAQRPDSVQWREAQ